MGRGRPSSAWPGAETRLTLAHCSCAPSSQARRVHKSVHICSDLWMERADWGAPSGHGAEAVRVHLYICAGSKAQRLEDSVEACWRAGIKRHAYHTFSIDGSSVSSILSSAAQLAGNITPNHTCPPVVVSDMYASPIVCNVVKMLHGSGRSPCSSELESVEAQHGNAGQHGFDVHVSIEA
jgi:hypothetical protein